jgi:hypothetical protein
MIADDVVAVDVLEHDLGIRNSDPQGDEGYWRLEIV